MIDEHGTIYVSQNTLRAVARCDTETALRYALDLTIMSDEAPALECGNAVHEVLADWFKGADMVYCLTKFELLYHGVSEEMGLGASTHPFHRLCYENVDKILREWFETHPMHGFPFGVNPKLVEVAFQIPLVDECVCGVVESGRAHKPGGSCGNYRPAFVFRGRLDAIVQSQHDNALYVLDHKTAGRMTSYWSEGFRNDSQMSGYVWAAQKTLGQPVVGVYINGIETSKLPSDPVRKCRDHGVVYAECGPRHMKSTLLLISRSPDQIEEWHASAVALARRYREILRTVPDIKSLTSVRMTGTFHGACSFCTFNPFCAANRPLEYAGTMLTKRPAPDQPL